MNDEKLENSAKYSIVLRFWSTPQEIEIIDYVGTINEITHVSHVRFIDITGRLWSVPESDVIIIKNYPDKDDFDDFERFKREVNDLNKKIEKHKKQANTNYNEVG